MSKQRIFIAGHRGMVGSAIRRQLEQRGDVELVLRTRDELNLLDSRAVHDFFASERIDQVYLAAAKVGGIVANNTYPADFIYQNMMIESNIIHAAHQNDVNKLLFLGSSCIYPKLAKQPMAESELLQGTLEPTNEPYAIAKIAGIKLCESYNRQYGRDYRSVMPTNLYGPHDNFHPSNSHVIPALLRRFHEATAQNAPDVVVWAAVRRCANFYTLMIWQRRAFMSWSWRTRSGRRTPGRCCRTLTSARALTALSVSWRKPSPKWWVTKVGWFLMPVNRMVRRANCWM